MDIDDIITELNNNPNKAEELFDVLNKIKNDNVNARNEKFVKEETEKANKWYKDDIEPKLKWSNKQPLVEQRVNIADDLKILTEKLNISVTRPFRRDKIEAEQKKSMEEWISVKGKMSKERVKVK